MNESTHREKLADDLLPIVGSFPFLERGRTLNPTMYPELVDFILAREKRLVGEAEHRSNKSLFSDTKYIEQAARMANLDQQIIMLKADIARAIGYCRGLGYPDDYLEERYPELVFEKKTNDDMWPEVTAEEKK